MKYKILIVDDDPIMGNLLEVRLSEAGFKAEYFDSGEEALNHIKQTKPELIISDIVMPGMNGYELHRRLRQTEETSDIPFIFLSAKNETADQLRGLRMGADDYVCKPFNIENLIERIEIVMENARNAKSFHTQADFSGSLTEMSLSDVFRVVELNHKSGELVLLDKPRSKKTGNIMFRKGKIINARINGLEGEDAFYDLLEETEGFFEFYGNKTDEPEKIVESNRAILLKGAYLIVESKKLYKRLSDLDIVLTHMPEISQAIEKREDREILTHIFSMINEERTVREIIHCGIMSRLTAASVLFDLISSGLVIPPDESKTASSGDSHETAPSPSSPTSSVIDEKLLKAIRSCEYHSATGILKIGNLPEKAGICFQNGKIINAFYGKKIARKALYKIFAEHDGAPGFHTRLPDVYHAIDKPLSALIEEGSKEIETFEQLKESDILNKRVVVNPHPPRKTSELGEHEGINYLLAITRECGIIRDIIEKSRMIDLHTYNNLMYMLKIGLISVESQDDAGIQLVTDSTADLPEDMLRKLNIRVIPLFVNINDTICREGVDITTEQFYSTLEASGEFPDTSPPAVKDFHLFFQEIVPHKDILAIFLSGKMSRTIEHARTAWKDNHEEYLNIRREKHGNARQLRADFIDSQSISMGSGLLLIEAAEKLEKGWSFEQVRNHVRNLISGIRLMFVTDTTAYLQRSGKVGKAKAWMDNILGIHPILSIWKGEIIVIDQIRGKKHAQDTMIELLCQSLEYPESPVKIGIIHANAPQLAHQMEELARLRLNCHTIITSPIGPVAGSHCGPGTIGIACLPLS